MKAMTIRNIPEDLYKAIVRLAKRNRRSIQQQVLVLLEKARALDDDSPLERAMKIRKSLEGRDLGDTVAEVRKERER